MEKPASPSNAIRSRKPALKKRNCRSQIKDATNNGRVSSITQFSAMPKPQINAAALTQPDCLADTIFQQAPDGRRQEQHVQHLARGGGGLLPETKLQSADHARQQHGQFVSPAVVGVPRAIPRQQLDGTGQQSQRQPPQTAENKFKLTGIQPAGRPRNGSVSSHTNGCPAIGCQSQPATFAANGRLCRVMPRLRVNP